MTLKKEVIIISIMYIKSLIRVDRDFFAIINFINIFQKVLSRKYYYVK